MRVLSIAISRMIVRIAAIAIAEAVTATIAIRMVTMMTTVTKVIAIMMTTITYYIGNDIGNDMGTKGNSINLESYCSPQAPISRKSKRAPRGRFPYKINEEVKPKCCFLKLPLLIALSGTRQCIRSAPTLQQQLIDYSEPDEQ